MTKKNNTFRQRGEAEMGFFMVVVIVCGIVSGSLFILNWVKDRKDAKVAATREARLARYRIKEEDRPRRSPGAYTIECYKSPWDIFGTKGSCDILADPLDFQLGDLDLETE